MLDEQNPWHSDGRVADALARSVARPLGTALWRRVLDDAPRRHHVILGPRRVGKTTVMYQTVRRLLEAGIEPRRLWWARVDHPLLVQLPLGDVVRRIVERSSATASEPVWVFLDEVVYADRWDLWLKTFYDDHWPVRVVATSSATAALRGGNRESGVGRWEEHLLLPYQLVEYLDLLGQATSVPVGASLAETVEGLPRQLPDGSDRERYRRQLTLVGGFPELITSGAASWEDVRSALLESQRRLREDAVERAVYRDIPRSFGIDDPLLLERLLYVLAGQVGGVAAPSSLAASLDNLSQPTIDRYLSYLEQAFLVFRVPNYSTSEETVQRRGRKVFFYDGAVRTAALQRGAAVLTDPAEAGLLAENLLAASLHGLGMTSGSRLHYWRQRDREVDFVLDHPTRPVAVEVASSSRHHRRGLEALLARYPRFAGSAYLTYPGAPFVLPDEDPAGVGTIGLDHLLLAVGAQARAVLASRLGSAS